MSTKQWGKHCIPLVQRIFNSQEKKSTGVTPAELLFGNTVSLGKEMLCRKPAEDEPDGRPKRLSEYMDKLLSTQAIFIKLAQEKQLSTDTHNTGTKEANFEDYLINSYVLFSGRP
jgi:hypothetical protein